MKLYEYQPDVIEQKWQAYWAQHHTFKRELDTSLPKYYVLGMFPYPSGAGLHVGHPEGYTATDIIARYKTMNGFNVLHPMGWDSFGLPAERAAMRTNQHPASLTKENTANFKRQIQRLGLAYDWDREISTSDPDYYRWTQWIFLKLFERGLAYLADVPVNWCPAQQTVLANEEVQDGRYVETGDPVEQKVMRQWMLKITEYAERLLSGLDDLDWPENVKEMQRHWIGQSQGLEIDFQVLEHQFSLTVFTTRPETLMGATFIVVAPNHPCLSYCTGEVKKTVEAYCQQVSQLSDRARETLAGKEKTGVYTGLQVNHPLLDQPLPVYVADYVKLDYGTGAVMSVPGHDERDRDFAEKFDLPIQIVINDQDQMIHSGVYDGLDVSIAKERIKNSLLQQGVARQVTTYKLRDWLFSRQRYWGEPFPIYYDEQGVMHTVKADSLPVHLPKVAMFKPTASGEPPLANVSDWVTFSEAGQTMHRETNTMPQWAGSCWYYLRYMDPKNTQAPFSFEAQAYWGQVDLYIGGLEHAVSHLLYARFWHKVLFDCGLVSHDEPFKKLFNQGMILAQSYRDQAGKYYHESDVVEEQGQFFTRLDHRPVNTMIEKMSKSKLNVVNPDSVVDEYGADALRLYEMFMGPLDMTKPWQMNGVRGVYHFLQRVWRLSIDETSNQLADRIQKDAPVSDAWLKGLHQTIQKVTQDIEALKFNTAVAQMMQFLNLCKVEPTLPYKEWSMFIQVLSPFAPHLAEEIWSALGHPDSIALSQWPKADEQYLKEHQVSINLCINGKKVKTIEIDSHLSQAEVEVLFMADEKIQQRLDGSQIKKMIYVPNRLMNALI
ncbi:MAG: leucine--tRNA ligase [Legionellales bacterium]|nr:leucine--tRNA ligase [Legionellales bacterium]OUX66877.1 MAG: leucine--tRNA ligase [bacterium TMED178]